MSRRWGLVAVALLVLGAALAVWRESGDGGEVSLWPRPQPATLAAREQGGDSTPNEAALPPSDAAGSGAAWSKRFFHQIGHPKDDPNFYDNIFAASERVLASIEGFLADPAPLQALKHGDLEAGMVPPEVGQRELSLTLLEGIALHPRTPPPVREQTLELLVRFVTQPLGAFYSKDGYIVAYQERGKALAFLFRAEREHAQQAYMELKNSGMLEAVRRETQNALIQSGMARWKVRRILSEVEQS